MAVKIGVITAWNARRGYGFARADDGTTVYVHASSLCSHLAALPLHHLTPRHVLKMLGHHTELAKGMRVWMSVGTDFKGDRSNATVCAGCTEVSALKALAYVIDERLRSFFPHGHSFEVDGRAWYYSRDMRSRNDAIVAFETAALAKILANAPPLEVLAAAEQAARDRWAEMQRGEAQRGTDGLRGGTDVDDDVM